uniref:Uncharacterized protein n=1 Tax=Arundo donax TaxID=35708 RepID=A0A0A8YC78_ARUDO
MMCLSMAMSPLLASKIISLVSGQHSPVLRTEVTEHLPRSSSSS